ncbi:SDR family NAD(P)-dependent oxidoreductase [Halalkalibacter alkaliphilus]|uniref:SDR family oxidoreductase n=1 Tax=Halalkalibacter alkaliphilus TaxID=2917993 RepID=A0A9X2IAQ3_9BACI|nr:SDR family oxidoreductase [Halalkalibacter alkaliphilus]MCL7749605.1 SDR family oxidoreductase [Halalkalibacter alkaliphilus]
MAELKEKRILVVGGASGIGLAIVERFLASRNSVAIMDINEEALLRFSTLDYWQDRVIAMKGDVRESADINDILTRMKKNWGGIDGLIYSAGIFPDRRIVEMSEEDWDNVLNINLKGAFLVCQAVARQMVEQKEGGHIVTISSGSYQSARVGSGHYCASKAGLVMLTKVLALELADHSIFVNSIAPGLVHSEKLGGEYIDTFSSRIPLGRPAQPEEIASIIELIMSPSNTYLTGQIIPVDGGLSSGHFGLPMSNKQK